MRGRAMTRPEQILEAIEARTECEPMSGCWLWIGQRNSLSGYGVLYIRGHLRLAHRLAYELFVGRIPKGLTLDHLCRTPACIKPAHVQPVTHAQNGRRGFISRNGMCYGPNRR